MDIIFSKSSIWTLPRASWIALALFDAPPEACDLVFCLAPAVDNFVGWRSGDDSGVVRAEPVGSGENVLVEELLSTYFGFDDGSECCIVDFCCISFISLYWFTGIFFHFGGLPLGNLPFDVDVACIGGFLRGTCTNKEFKG
jgi:hypothetical protein